MPITLQSLPCPGERQISPRAAFEVDMVRNGCFTYADLARSKRRLNAAPDSVSLVLREPMGVAIA